MKDLELAKSLLKDDKTLVLVKSNNVLTSNLNGIKPLITYLNSGVDLSGYSIADKIIGKAQAMLIVKANINEAYAKVMSTSGKNILDKYKISYSYENLVDKIINRQGNDICPMEKTVLNINDIEDAYNALNETLSKLNNN